MSALSPILARWPWFALLASAAMLGIAHAFQTFGHLAPCTLCLKQREAYWIAGTIALVGAALSLTPARARMAQLVDAVLMIAFLYGFGYAVYHAGAEWHFWPGPKECSGGTTVSAASIDALLKGAKVTMPACDRPAWVFLGLSMAGWNALISLGLAGLSGLAAVRRPAA
jgi:disulfide bond formation protein DsbB